MKPKQLIKRQIARAASFASWNSQTSKSSILCYHSISDDLKFSDVDVETFEQHLRMLVEEAEVVRLADLATESAATGTRVAITFDDGYIDNYEVVLPLLLKYGVQATFFITSGLVRGDATVREHIAALWGTPVSRVEPLRPEHILELRHHGMSIGAHSVSHVNLARLADVTALTDELAEPKVYLETLLGEPVNALAYPFGKWRIHINDAVVRAARDVGYELAVSATARTLSAHDDPMRLPRFFTATDGVDVLRNKINGRWNAVGAWQERAPLALLKAVSPRDFQY